MKYGITRLDLGRTRLGVGWVCYDSNTKAFDELTPTEVKQNIQKKNMIGLMLDDGNIVIDNTFCKDFMRKSGVGNFALIKGDYKSNVKGVLTVVSENETEFGMMYEVVSNFCQRLIMNAETLKSYIVAGVVNGADIVGEDIITHEDIERSYITKPASLSKDDLYSAKIDINTEHGKSLVDEIKNNSPKESELETVMEAVVVTEAEPVVSMVELFDELEVAVEKEEEFIDKSNADITEDCSNDNSDIDNSENANEDKSESSNSDRDTKSKSKSKRNKKS